MRPPPAPPRKAATTASLVPGESGSNCLVTLRIRMVPNTESLQTVAESLCATARWCYTQGWVPATSGNFSVRVNGRILITASGLDKGTLKTEDLLEVDGSGQVLSGAGRPPAENGLHPVVDPAGPQAGGAFP